MRGGWALVLLLGCLSSGAGAEAPGQSVRPLANPAFTPSVVEAAPAPVDPVPAEPALAEQAAPVAATGSAPMTSLRPLARPNLDLAAANTAEAVEPQGKKKTKASKKGSVCGDPDIKGEALARIKGKVKGCGLDKPVRVTSISGVRLNQPATISCETAAATKRWIEKALIPALGRRELIEIRVAASYICRPRNNKKGAKISEHGRGKAIDVSGFVFADGTEWSILRDYNKQIRRAHKDACGIFGTTLGPGSDGYHEDHLHFDIAQHRSGAYCR